MSTHWFAVILLLASVSSDANISGAETLPGPAKAQPALLNNTSPVLRFVVYYPHFPPYIYMEPPQNQVIGIIPDLLAPLFQQLGISVEYLLDNRAGAEKRLYKGDVDAMMLSADWATHPEQLLFSDAIIPYHDYLFARSEQELQQLPQQLHGKKICTREYYVYPELEPLFSADTLVRIDSSSQEAQLRMVFNQRCDLVYMNDLIAKWLLQRSFAGLSLHAADVHIGRSALTIALHPRWQALLPQLNRFLQQQQQSGEVQRVISHYVR